MVSRVKTWVANETLTASDLNTEFNTIISAVGSGTADHIDLTDIYAWSGAHSWSAATTHTNTLTVGVDDAGHDVKFFGNAAGAFSLWDASADTHIIRGATAAGPGTLNLSTGELTVVDGDILGRIDFQAPLEASGTDAILVGASIWAEADDTFGTALNDTDLVFAVAESETAAERMRLSYDGTTVGLTFPGVTTISTAAGALNLTPAAGSAIVLDGTISVDAGVVTGATSITSTAFVGDITGDVTGNTDTFTATANNSANETVYPVFVDGATGTQGAETDTGLTYNPSTGLLSSAAVTTTGVVTAATCEATGDTSAGDNAAMGYTSAEGLILTGQGSTNDVTIKNDADGNIMVCKTGGTVVDFPGKVGIGTAHTEGTLHVHTATANTVTASTSYDDLVVENSGVTGISILSPDASTAGIAFGHPTDNLSSIIYNNYNSGNDILVFYHNGAEAMRIDGSQNVGIGTTTPQLPLTAFATQAAPATTGGTPNGVLALESNGGNSLFIGAYSASPYGNWIQVADGGALGTTYPLILQPVGGNVGIGTTAPNESLTLEAGVVSIKEVATPTATTNYGKVYTKTDNKLYFQDGAGSEHELAFA
jgi:hypothetical protein